MEDKATYDGITKQIDELNNWSIKGKGSDFKEIIEQIENMFFSFLQK